MTYGHELTSATEIDIEVLPNNDPGIGRNDSGPTAKELELLERRELALMANDAISEVFNIEVTPGMLLTLADAQEKTDVRLAAVRALRCIEAIGRRDSDVVAAVGEKGIYHYVEGVIQYGASEKYYLALSESYSFDAEQVTSLYDLREQIAIYTNGQKPGFRTIHAALESIGMTVRNAVRDTEAAVAALDEAGCFVAWKGSRTFDQPILSVKLGATETIVDEDPDRTVTKGILEAIRGAAYDPDEAEIDTVIPTATDFVNGYDDEKMRSWARF